MFRRCAAAAADHVGTSRGELSSVRGKSFGIHIKNCFSTFQARDSGVGFSQKRNGRVWFHRRDKFQHFFGPGRAVAAYGIGTQTLQGDEGTYRISSAEGVAVIFIGHGYNRKDI